MNGEYFKTLRRKIGMLTLGLACMFAIGWVRSLVVIDAFFLYPKGQIESDGDLKAVRFVNSREGGVELVTWGCSEGMTISLSDRFHRTLPLGVELLSDRHSSEPRFQFCGLEYRQGQMEPSQRNQVTVFKIPYWSFVIPLTLLTAWLLLGKPRAKTIESNESLFRTEC